MVKDPKCRPVKIGKISSQILPNKKNLKKFYFIICVFSTFEYTNQFALCGICAGNPFAFSEKAV
jgi:hypothetical protein